MYPERRKLRKVSTIASSAGGRSLAGMRKPRAMKSKWVWALLAGVLGAAVYGGTVLATPPSEVTTTVFAVGRFDEIDAKSKTDVDPGRGKDFWQARINTKGSSDLHVLQTIAPAGTFGWHSHPGPSVDR